MSLQVRATGRARDLVRGDATPQRLRRVGAVLVLAALLTGLAGTVSALDRAGSVADGGSRLASLTADAAQLYRSLADADAMATSGYVSGGTEPAAVRDRYDADITAAADGLVAASSRVAAGDPAALPLSTVAAQLPVYAGLVDTARAYNRQGLPLGQAYLGSASRLMRDTILPAAAELRAIGDERLTDAFDRGRSLPVIVLVFGIAALVALVDAGRRERRRTHRRLDAGLVGAGAALVVLLLWWVVTMSFSGAALAGATRHAAASAALDDARAAVLQARSNESLVLVARGSDNATDADFAALLERVLGPGGYLEQADGAEVAPVRAGAQAWSDAHVQLRALDDGGDYPAAVASATGTSPDGSGQAFERVDSDLGEAITVERTAFDDDAGAASGAWGGLAVGSAVLGVLAAAAAAAGIGRRLGEYR